jgi:hypothetical protein
MTPAGALSFIRRCVQSSTLSTLEQSDFIAHIERSSDRIILVIAEILAQDPALISLAYTNLKDKLNPKLSVEDVLTKERAAIESIMANS